MIWGYPYFRKPPVRFRKGFFPRFNMFSFQAWLCLLVPWPSQRRFAVWRFGGPGELERFFHQFFVDEVFEMECCFPKFWKGGVHFIQLLLCVYIHNICVFWNRTLLVRHLLLLFFLKKTNHQWLTLEAGEHGVLNESTTTPSQTKRHGSF